jgi:NADPH:quinone reductase-like Zn-dependent oxidoreductase
VDFEVRKDDLKETRIADGEEPKLERGQVLLGVDTFGLTTNNITYALVGESMNYWDFFPAPDGWGRVPVWGFADVVASEADGVEEGTRVFGYLPPGDHLVVQPDRPSPTDFVDASPHRAELPAAYNRYVRTAGDDKYTEDSEDQQMLLWPLYFTSALIDDFIDDKDFFGAKSVLIASASSRTASALAWLLSKRGGADLIGLTSPRNVEFVESLGVYDRVVPYEEIESLPKEPTMYVDMAGDAKVRSAVHGHLEDELKADSVVGMTHKDELGGAEGLPGPAPKFFFAPARLKKRAEDWGPEELNKRVGAQWLPYVEWTRDWLEVNHESGPEAIERIYLELLDGQTDPSVGHVLTPNGD